MCDRWDIGGLSTNFHPQTGRPDDLHLRRPPRRRRDHAPGLPALRGARRRRPPADRRVPVRVGLPVVRAVAEVRQPQRAAREGGRARGDGADARALSGAFWAPSCAARGGVQVPGAELAHSLGRGSRVATAGSTALAWDGSARLQGFPWRSPPSSLGVAPAAVAYAGGAPAPSRDRRRPSTAPRSRSAHPSRPVASRLHGEPEGRRRAAAAAPSRARRPARRADGPRARRLSAARRARRGRARRRSARSRPAAHRASAGRRGSQLPPGALLVRAASSAAAATAVLAAHAPARAAHDARVDRRARPRRRRPRRPPRRLPAPAATGRASPSPGPHTYGDGFGAARNGHTHQGQDILAAEGTPVVAPLAGTIALRRQPGRRRRATTSSSTPPTAATSSSPTARRARSRVAPGAAVAAGPAALPRRPHRRRDRPAPALRDLGRRLARRARASHFIDPLPDLQAWDPTV